jgi:hypothetical protein
MFCLGRTILDYLRISGVILSRKPPLEGRPAPSYTPIALPKESLMWSAIASILLGAAGWFAASFFGKPLLDFLNLRREVHEEIIFTANIGQMISSTSEHDQAQDTLRRLGARMQATHASALSLLRWFLSKAGYDLVMAGGGLIGLSNALEHLTGTRDFHTNSIRVGLKLPDNTMDYRNKVLEQVPQKKERPL